MSFTDNPMWKRNPVGAFNTNGLTKCPHCSDYKPDRTIDSHMTSCGSNPDNQTPPATTEE